MSIQSNFPNLKPSLLLDFANTKQLDNRVTFTRSTPAVYYDGETTAMAEQNLLYPSVNIGSPYQNNANALTNNTGTAPDGTTTASLLVPNTTNTRHYCSSPLASNGILNTPYTISLFAKPSGYNFIFVQFSGSVSSGGSRYGVTFNISTGAIETSGFSYSLNVSSTSSTITSVGSGWYRITMTATMTNTATNPMCYVQPMPLNGSTYPDGGDGLPSYAGDGTNGAYIWGFQLEQRSSATAYTATTSQAITNYIPVLLTAGGNQPRFDCNPTTGESLGLLIEESRTNLASYSSQFNDSYWAKVNCSITENANVAPDGTLSADLATATSGTEEIYTFVSKSSSSITYTLSVYAKNYKDVTTSFSIYLSDNTTGQATGSYNFSTVSASASNGSWSNSSATITSVGNGWFRCTLTATSPANSGLLIGFTWGSSSGQAVFLWGSQLEAASFASSYIATTSASATRTADLATMTGTNFSSWFNNDQGVFVTQFMMPNPTGQIRRLWDIENTNTSTYQNFIAYNGYSGSNSIMYFEGGANNTGQFAIDTGSFNANTSYRVSMGYQTNNFATSTNGGSAQTDLVGIVPNGLNALWLGSHRDGNWYNGYINKFAYYPQRLTNTNLQALSS